MKMLYMKCKYEFTFVVVVVVVAVAVALTYCVFSICSFLFYGSHIGGQKQYIFSPLGITIYFHAKLFHCSGPPTWPP